MKRHTALTCCKYVLFVAALLPMAVIVLVMFPLLTWPWRIGTLMPFIVLILWGTLEVIERLLRNKSHKARTGAQ